MDKAEKRNSLIFGNVYKEGKSGWCLADNFEGIFVSSDNMESVHLVKAFPDFSFHTRAFLNCIKCEEDIFCFPYRRNFIWLYNLRTEIFQKIEIDTQEKAELVILDFWRVDKELYAISKATKEILRISIKEKRC